MAAPKTQEQAKSTELALTAKNIVTITTAKVMDFVAKGDIRLPADYSPENALKSAYVIFAENPDLQKCDLNSVANALLDMVVWGLNPAKKQCYLIPYGGKAACQRSYFGELALAKRIEPTWEPYYDVIYEGEECLFDKKMTKKGFVTVVTKHPKPFPRKSTKIIGAYAGFVDTETGDDLGVELMDIAQIQKSWTKSKTMGPKSFHAEQPDQAALRTVIRRRCKFVINSSDDKMLTEAIRRQDQIIAESEIDAEAAELANAKVIDVTPIVEAQAVEIAAGDETEAPEAPNADPDTGVVEGQGSLEDPGY